MAACIEHNQRGNKGGYGTGKVAGKTEYLHRMAYCVAVGAPLESIRGQVVMHTCDNPRCVNPKHLRLGTHQDNTDDMINKGRQRYLSGEDAPRAILTTEQVAMIKATYKPRCPVHGTRALGRALRVSNTTVRDVLKGRTWA